METWIFVVISAVWKLQISWVKTFRGRGDGSTHVTETAHIFFDTTNQNIQVEPPEMELMYLAGRLIPSWCFFPTLLKNMRKSIWIISHRGENKKDLKPPPRYTKLCPD